MSAEELKPRITHDGPITVAEFGLKYEDGYRVTVEWSDDDGAWLARLTGFDAKGIGTIIADAQSRELALAALCCSIAATLDAIASPSSPEKEG